MKHNKTHIRIILGMAALFIMLLSQSSFAQIYTPQGSPVTVYNIGEQFTNAQKIAIRQDLQRRYPNAIYVDEATTTYNCHAYAWSVSEGGSKYWMNSPNDDIYMTDGSYTQTYLSDSKATKVSYADDDHSAIVSYGGYLISKWGALCLMKHRPNDCPYTSNNLKYYKLSMSISGEENIQLPSNTATVTKQYTLSNIPANATVNWSVSPGASILSGQGSQTIQVAFTGTGIRNVKAVVHTSTGQSLNIPPLTVTTSIAPIVTDIEIFKYFQGTGEFTLKAVTNNPNGIFTWTIASGNAELYELPYPDDASFLEFPNIFAAIRFYEYGWCTVTVTSTDINAIQSYTYSKSFSISEIYETQNFY